AASWCKMTSVRKVNQIATAPQPWWGTNRCSASVVPCSSSHPGSHPETQLLMLTLVEKVLFVLLVAAALYLAWQGFSKVWRVITRGSGEAPRPGLLARRALTALGKWIFTAPAWQTRRLSTLLHLGISAGFVFYFLVNFGDVLEGFLPIHFLAGADPVSRAYRLLADFFTISVLVGMVYFLLRRFVFVTPRLKFRENVLLMDAVRDGAIRRDSLIVGLFILVHVGSRFLGKSFQLAVRRSEGVANDAFQPFS